MAHTPIDPGHAQRLIEDKVLLNDDRSRITGFTPWTRLLLSIRKGAYLQRTSDPTKGRQDR